MKGNKNTTCFTVWFSFAIISDLIYLFFFAVLFLSRSWSLSGSWKFWLENSTTKKLINSGLMYWGLFPYFPLLKPELSKTSAPRVCSVTELETGKKKRERERAGVRENLFWNGNGNGTILGIQQS